MAKNDLFVFIECDENSQPKSVGLELLTPGRELAKAQGGRLIAAVITEHAAVAAEKLAPYGVDQVLAVEGEAYRFYSTEVYAHALAEMIRQAEPATVLIGATNNGRDLGPRLASRLKTGLTADCTSLGYDPESGNILWTRPAFGGNLMAQIVCPDTRPQLGTVRPGIFAKSPADCSVTPPIQYLSVTVPETASRVRILEVLREAAQTVDITAAEEANSMETYKIFAINLGSTSTKVAYYENSDCILKETIRHKEEDLNATHNIFDQYKFRRQDIQNFMDTHNIKADELDALVSRGGPTQPIDGGTYLIDEDMLSEIRTGKYGIHPCSLGCQIAYDITAGKKAVPLTVDMPGTCEFNPLAFYSGMPDIIRFPIYQALNNRALAQKYAQSIGRKYEDMNILICNLGGGISVTIHEKGRMVDAQNGIAGDGAFSNNRCNAVPIGPLVDMCYSGKYTYEEMLHKINGNAGLMGYVGSIDIISIEKKAQEGDAKCAEALAAMCYQVSKDVGAFATVVDGQVDVILISGGMANSEYIVGLIRDRVQFIAPVVVLPGELEMESLCVNAYRALTKQIPIKHFREGKLYA